MQSGGLYRMGSGGGDGVGVYKIEYREKEA